MDYLDWIRVTMLYSKNITALKQKQDVKRSVTHLSIRSDGAGAFTVSNLLLDITNAVILQVCGGGLTCR